MNKPTDTTGWAAELTQVMNEDSKCAHPGEGWLTLEELKELIEKECPGVPTSNYHLRGFISKLRAKGRVEMATRYMLNSITNDRRRTVFYKLKDK